MSYNNKKIKQIDKRSKYIVYGYIRNIQQILSSYHINQNNVNIAFFNIPDSIICQCLLFYYMFEFKYNKTQYNVDENTNIITKIGNDTWIGTILIGEWMNLNENIKNTLTLKIIKSSVLSGIMIGIVPEKDNNTNILNTYIRDYKNGYCYQSQGHVHYNSQKTLDLAKYIENDILSLTMDSKSRSMSYVIKSMDGSVKKSILWENIVDGKYKWAVTLGYVDNSVQILHE